MSGHTPGPWKVTPDSFVMSGTKPSIGVAKIITHVYEFPANARLIAAAPDLLEAIKAIKESFRTGVGMMAAQDIAEAAIIKAEGR